MSFLETCYRFSLREEREKERKKERGRDTDLLDEMFPTISNDILNTRLGDN